MRKSCDAPEAQLESSERLTIALVKLELEQDGRTGGEVEDIAVATVAAAAAHFEFFMAVAPERD
jgi:hypothetical protein